MQDIATKVDGTSTLSAAEFNQIPSEMENLITTSGQTLSSGDLNQVAKAAANYAAIGAFYTDSGIADAYVLTNVGSFKAPSAYTNGMVVRFKPGNVNTGASTVNVASLGVKSIKKADGSTDPAAGELEASKDISLIYDGTYFRIYTPATPIQAASQAELETGSSTTVFTSPGRQQYHASACKVWILFNGTGTVSITNSYNVTSITDHATGDYTITFTNALNTSNFATAVFASADPTVTAVWGGNTYARTTSSTRIQTAAATFQADITGVNVCIFST